MVADWWLKTHLGGVDGVEDGAIRLATPPLGGSTTLWVTRNTFIALQGALKLKRVNL